MDHALQTARPAGPDAHPTRWVQACDNRCCPQQKTPASLRGLLLRYCLERLAPDQKSMPPMPPMPPPAGIAGSSFFGDSATIASVAEVSPRFHAGATI